MRVLEAGADALQEVFLEAEEGGADHDEGVVVVVVAAVANGLDHGFGELPLLGQGHADLAVGGLDHGDPGAGLDPAVLVVGEKPPETMRSASRSREATTGLPMSWRRPAR
jgi:hypothetical protein